MKVKELKKALVNVPDSAEVFIERYSTYSKELNNIKYDRIIILFI